MVFSQILTYCRSSFAKGLGFKDRKSPVKIRYIFKIEKNNSIDITTLCYENKVKYSIYVSQKCCEDKLLPSYKSNVLIFSLIRAEFFSSFENIVLIFSLIRTYFLALFLFFFLFFLLCFCLLLSIYKMVNSKYNTDDYNSSKLSIEAII